MGKNESLDLKNSLFESWIKQLKDKRIMSTVESDVILEYLFRSKLEYSKINPIKSNEVKDICNKIDADEGGNFFLVNNSYSSLSKNVNNLDAYLEITKRDTEYFIRNLLNTCENIGAFTYSFLNSVVEKNQSSLKENSSAHEINNTDSQDEKKGKLSLDGLSELTRQKCNSCKYIEENAEERGGL